MEMPSVDSRFVLARPFIAGGESIRSPARNPGSIRSARSRESAEVRLALTDPAVHVVTDFVIEPPVTVPEESSIDAALRKMIRAAVRALLVVRDEVVTGLITSYD